MASSETEVPEQQQQQQQQQLSSFFERLFGHRDLSLFFPFAFGSTNFPAGEETASPTQENPHEETPQTTGTNSPHERIILINPLTQGMVVIEGEASNLETLLGDLASKSGQPPASRASIEAMPSVEIGEGEDREEECVVCLEEWEVGGVAKVMPCNHKFHPNCIEKWLGIHGNCPVCRYKMPVEEKEMGKKEVEGLRRMGREVWVSFSFNGGRRNSGDQNQSQEAFPSPATSENSGVDVGSEMEG